ncbi:MAG: hypothetical protein H6R10_3288 [Rhodocyclaceae bacterium]|nr:hypothetical protein [Rhodocyclaceae bacterium]
MGRKKSPKVHHLAIGRSRVLVDQLTEEQARQVAAVAMQLQYLFAVGVFWLNPGCRIEDEQLADVATEQLNYLIGGIVESEGGEL